MNAKAKLVVVLKADDTIVAEKEDALLWQRVLGIIHGGGSAADLVGKQAASDFADQSTAVQFEDSGGGDRALVQLAKRLGVPTSVVEGALSPSREPPYLRLNDHNWEDFRKALPQRGVGAIPPIAIAGTLLALWLKEANLGVSATQGLAAQVLDAIGVRDPNPSRGIRNTEWLQARAGGTIILNPAEISRAVRVARGFCMKKAPDNE
jgi:hypothetical protein